MNDQTFNLPTFKNNGINSLGFRKLEINTKVVVAMSGGVDSSVTAAYLHEQGYQVIGITMKLHNYSSVLSQKKGSCCAVQDIHDARRIAELLKIPYYVLNYESIFKKKVIDNFVDSYISGETPIPCIKCNQTVKFQDLLSMAKDLDADCMATGHYVKRYGNEKCAKLFRGLDLNKDQSYFLFLTTQQQLDFIRFPIGCLLKSEVRKMASKYKLSVADKPDSQDICFVPNGNYKSMIQKLNPKALIPGNIVDINGKIIGKHKGIINYTIGQRKGIGGGYKNRLYVIKLNPNIHEVVVGSYSELEIKHVYINNINWLGDGNIEDNAKNNINILVKLRSTMKPIKAKLKMNKLSIYIELEKKQTGISNGQACVIYGGKNNNQVLGGGWISKTN